MYMFIYILSVAPEPGLALSWSMRCLLSYCPELRFILDLSYCVLTLYCRVAPEVLMTSDVASGGSVIASECVLALDSLDSRVPRATTLARLAPHPLIRLLFA